MSQEFETIFRVCSTSDSSDYTLVLPNPCWGAQYYSAYFLREIPIGLIEKGHFSLTYQNAVRSILTVSSSTNSLHL